MSIRVTKEPAWLSSLADQKLAMVEHSGAPAMAKAQGITVIMTFLTEPETDSQQAVEFWENACDNCKKFPGAQHGAHVERRARNGVPVVMTFNVCDECKTTID